MNKLTHQLKGLVFAFAILLLPHFLTAQNVTVRGKITDADTGKPVESATVTPKNAKNATMGKIPKRFQYPTNESTVNSANLEAALQSQFGGAGDDINQDLWIVK